MTLHLIRKSHFLMLEVLIALAIVAVCILPLLAPQAEILKQQKKFIQTMSVDHAVNLLYVDVLDQLQHNSIPWQAIKEHTNIPVDESMRKRIGDALPRHFTGTFRFDEHVMPSGRLSVKGNKAEGWFIYRLVLTFVFTSTTEARNPEKFIFPYEVCVLRRTTPETSQEPEGKE